MAKQPNYRIRKKVGDNWQDAGAVWVNQDKGTLGIQLNLGALGKVNLTAVKIEEKKEEKEELF